MNLEELKAILDSTGFPVAYHSFIESENSPLPETPFIVFLCTYSSNLSADNLTYFPMQNVQIELYTDKKDLLAESIIEAVLNANEIPFATTESFIESENMFQKIYEMRLY
jgi:hypothetical protein